MIASAHNCIEVFAWSNSSEAIFSLLPSFTILPSWIVANTDVNPPQQLVKIRTMDGKYFCAGSNARPACKFHLSTASRFEAAEACVIRWAIAGSAMNAIEHAAAGPRAAALFKASLAPF